MNWRRICQGPESNSDKNRGFEILCCWAEMPPFFGCQGQGFVCVVTVRRSCRQIREQPRMREDVSKPTRSPWPRLAAYKRIGQQRKLVTCQVVIGRVKRGRGIVSASGRWHLSGRVWMHRSVECVLQSNITGGLCTVDHVVQCKRRQLIPIGPVGGAVMCLLLRFVAS
jgi:hypothetical protein